MPQRTNARQSIIYLLRKYSAVAGTQVTESAMLRDAATGQLREVDIVLEAFADRDPVTISIEVVNRARPADRTWVEQVIKKHERLPTNRLVLVSWSGFTAQAAAAAEAEGGRVVTMTPRQMEEQGVPIRHSMRSSAVAFGWPQSVSLRATRGDEEFLLGGVGLGMPILDASGAAIGTCASIAEEVCLTSSVREEVDTSLRDHGPELVDGAAYSVNRVDVADKGWFVRLTPADSLLHIHRVTVAGILHVAEIEVDLWLTRLGEFEFRAGEGSFKGRPAVWLEVPSGQGTRLIFRDY